MKTTAIALLALLLLWPCAMATAQDNPPEVEDWTVLFNGKDLEGWQRKGGEATYKVEDGAIVGTSVPNTQNTFLCTKKDYADFVFEFEFKGHPQLNSGVQFRSTSTEKYKKGRVHGYQCELEDEAQDRDWFCGIYDEGRRGWLFPTKEDKDKEVAAQFGEAGKRLWKNGEWNKVCIEAKDERLRIWLNDELRTDIEDGMTPAGFIGLQVHGVGKREEPLSVAWRNIRIKELE